MHVGLVVEAERVGGWEKLLLLKADLWLTLDRDESGTLEFQRPVVAWGSAGLTSPEWLAGNQVVILVNLEPRVINKRVASQGMLIVVDSASGPVLVVPEREVETGSVLC